MAAPARMNWIFYIVTALHVVVCLFLIIVVLIQQSKGADVAAAFGGMGSQTAFGPRGAATLLTRVTAIAAALFMITSLTLSIWASRGIATGSGGSVLADEPAQQSQPEKK